MSQTGYEPTIRDGGADTETADKLRNANDPYPFIKRGSNNITNFDETMTCVENLNVSMMNLDGIIYDITLCTVDLEILVGIKQGIIEHGINSSHGRYLSLYRGRSYVSATEAITDTSSAIRSVFIKLTEYIRKVSASLSSWMVNISELHKRTISSIVELNKQYKNVYIHNKEQFRSLVLDIDNGGCPTEEALLTLLKRTKDLMTYLDDPKNSVVTVLGRLLVKAKLIYSSGDTSALDAFLSKNEEDKEDTSIIDDFAGIQEKFTGVGISFGEDMMASFEDVLEYKQEVMSDLGYDIDSFKKMVAEMPTYEQIEKCKFLSIVLNRLSTYFSAVKIKDESGETDKYDTYINTIPKILTIIISIYRTSILAVREYSTTVLRIEKTLVEKFS